MKTNYSGELTTLHYGRHKCKS